MFCRSSYDTRTLEKNLKSIQQGIDKLIKENASFNESYTQLSLRLQDESSNVDNKSDIYNEMRNKVVSACFDFLKDSNSIQADLLDTLTIEQDEEEQKAQQEYQKEAISNFYSSLNKIFYEYKSRMFTIGEEVGFGDFGIKNDDSTKTATFIYKDGYKSDKLSVELINKYPGSYYYKELYSNRRTEEGYVLLNWDHENEEFLVKYMENDHTYLNDTISKMDEQQKIKILQDLELFQLPINVESIYLLCMNREQQPIEEKEDIVHPPEIVATIENIDKTENKGITEETHNDKETKTSDEKENQDVCYNESLEETHNDKETKTSDEKENQDVCYNESLEETHNDKETNTSSMNISSKYIKIIEDYLNHKNILNFDLIKKIEDYKYDDFVAELELKGISLPIEELNKLKQLDSNYKDEVVPQPTPPSPIFSFANISKILDKKYDPYLFEWLGTDYEWKCIYRASEHNFTAESFHQYCDNVGPTLIVVQSHKSMLSSGGWIFGGYTTQSWKSNGKLEDHDAFLFTLNNPYKILPTRFKSLKTSKGGIECIMNRGPIFCGRNEAVLCIGINKKCNEENSCYILNIKNEGYANDSKYRSSLFVNSEGPDHKNYFSVSDYEVFCIKDIDTYMKKTELSLELPNVEVIETPLKTPSTLLSSSIIVDQQYDGLFKTWLRMNCDWKCIYRASENHFNVRSFHAICDESAPTLIVVKSHNGWIFGGYTTQKWGGRGYKKDDNAFLFTLLNPHGVKPTQFNAYIGKGYILCNQSKGPTFCNVSGCTDIAICENGRCSEFNSCSILNNGTNGYECDPLYKSSLFVSTNRPENINYFSVSDYEVFTPK